MADDTSQTLQLGLPQSLIPLAAKAAVRLPGRLPARLPARLYDGLLAVGGVALTGLIALLDYVTGPELSFGIFYLIPVATCAWWGGFAQGILLRSVRGSPLPRRIGRETAVPRWRPGNGVVGFGTLVLASSLIASCTGGSP